MLWLWTILSCAVAFVAIVWVWFRTSNRHVIRLCSGIPSAQPSYPLLGNTLLFACSLDKMTKNFIEVIKETVLKRQRAVCFWFGPCPIVFVTDPNDIKTILNNSLSKGKVLEDCSEEYLQHGLVTSPVDHWKVTRRHLNLSFHPRNLEQLMPTFNLTSRRLVADLSGHVDGAVFNLMPHVMSAVLRTICTFLYGPRAEQLISAKQYTDLLYVLELLAEIYALRLTRPWLNNGTVFKLLYAKEIFTVKTTFQSIFHTANADSARRVLLTNKERDGSDAEHDKTPPAFQTILDAMRKLQERASTITDQHVMEEIKGFFITGTDTVGSAVSSCLLALARFPHIQTKVYEEICSVMSEEDEDVAHSHLKRLTYLDRVIKETLRFFTVVPFTPREPNRDVDLGGYTIPASQLTILCLCSWFFDSKFFPDPDKFDPDRFLQSDVLDDVFIPFSRGPRNCIGKAYAMMLIKVMVVHFIRKYRLSTNMDIQNLNKKFSIVFTCCDGYNVSLSERSK